MRCSARAISGLMPSTGWSNERVAISPSSQGILTSYLVVPLAMSGTPNSVKAAGGGSVSHIASIAAIFIFWLKPAV